MDLRQSRMSADSRPLDDGAPDPWRTVGPSGSLKAFAVSMEILRVSLEQAVMLLSKPHPDSSGPPGVDVIQRPRCVHKLVDHQVDTDIRQEGQNLRC